MIIKCIDNVLRIFVTMIALNYDTDTKLFDMHMYRTI